VKPITRTILLRLFGLLVAVAFGVAATSLVIHGLQLDGDWLKETLSDLAAEVVRPLDEGWAVLAGAGLTLAALLAAAIIVIARRRPTVLVEKSDAGTSRLEMNGVARLAQRHLRSRVNPQIDVRARRRSIVATVPTGGAGEPLEMVDDAAVALATLLDDIGVGSVRSRVETGRPSRSRVR
jgi:hypothetical protein